MTDFENELPFASDQECEEQRQRYIERGIIKTNCSEENLQRNSLIESGLINQNMCKLSNKDTRHVPKQEGEYVPIPIKNDKDYYRKRQLYFYSLQEILKARIDLKLGPTEI
jgi:hypothetical protein